jgi:hypothetical protein
VSRRLVFCLLLLLPALAWGHKPSDGYLMLQTEGEFSGRMDIALRDLEQAVGVDLNGDGALTWGELKQRREAVWQYLSAGLRLKDAQGAPCALTARDYLVTRHSDGTYATLLFGSECASPATLSYGLLFDIDPLHRGLLQVSGAGGTATAVLSPDRSTYELTAPPSLWRLWADYVWQGIWHVIIGLDHVLFLLLLILPAVRGREEVGGVRAIGWDVAKVVTAFTIAHSITLSLATLGYLDLPSRWVEAGIAASVVLAAVNNLYPLLGRRRWLLAFGFGLIHGLGFASVLADLGLPSALMALALVAFNVGVELGQLGLVALVLPLLLLMRDWRLYRGLLFPAGSALAGLVGAVWFVERVMPL